MSRSFPFHSAKFVTSATSIKGLPPAISCGKLTPEIAVAGRSNVGKSTLLQGLFRNKKLVKASATPGKTQLLNYFTIGEQLSVVDLPGYGFANVPEKIRKQWDVMISSYLNNRESLKVILLLIDIRRKPNESDRLLLDWACEANKSVIIVLTKIDKISKSGVAKNRDAILASLDYENLHYTYFSSKQNCTLSLLINTITDAVTSEMEHGAIA